MRIWLYNTPLEPVAGTKIATEDRGMAASRVGRLASSIPMFAGR